MGWDRRAKDDHDAALSAPTRPYPTAEVHMTSAPATFSCHEDLSSSGSRSWREDLLRYSPRDCRHDQRPADRLSSAIRETSRHFSRQPITERHGICAVLMQGRSAEWEQLSGLARARRAEPTRTTYGAGDGCTYRPSRRWRTRCRRGSCRAGREHSGANALGLDAELRCRGKHG